MEPDAIGPAIPNAVIPKEVAVFKIECTSPGIIRLKAHAIGEALVRAKLEGTELYAGVVAKILDGLGPAEALIRASGASFCIKEPAFIGAQSSETHDGRLVDVVVCSSGCH